MRKIRVTAMDEETAELLDEVTVDVSDNITELEITGNGFYGDSYTLHVGRKA